MSNGRSNLNVNIFFVLISKAIIILIPNRHAVFFFPSDSGAWRREISDDERFFSRRF